MECLLNLYTNLYSHLSRGASRISFERRWSNTTNFIVIIVIIIYKYTTNTIPYIHPSQRYSCPVISFPYIYAYIPYHSFTHHIYIFRFHLYTLYTYPLIRSIPTFDTVYSSYTAYVYLYTAFTIHLYIILNAHTIQYTVHIHHSTPYTLCISRIPNERFRRDRLLHLTYKNPLNFLYYFR